MPQELRDAADNFGVRGWLWWRKVALPAVAVYNIFGRWLKTIVARSECIGHALASHLKSVFPEAAPRAGGGDR